MRDHAIGCLPVTDEHGRVAGVVTDRDLCMAAYFQNRPPSEIPLAGVMAQQVCTCLAEDDLVQAERIMAEKQIHRLPVVADDGSLIGILSLADVARQTRATPSRQREEAVSQLAQTVTAISEPHRTSAAGTRAH
jgi:CBS domain-containing protein